MADTGAGNWRVGLRTLASRGSEIEKRFQVNEDRRTDTLNTIVNLASGIQADADVAKESFELQQYGEDQGLTYNAETNLYSGVTGDYIPEGGPYSPVEGKSYQMTPEQLSAGRYFEQGGLQDFTQYVSGFSGNTPRSLFESTQIDNTNVNIEKTIPEVQPNRVSEVSTKGGPRRSITRDDPAMYKPTEIRKPKTQVTSDIGSDETSQSSKSGKEAGDDLSGWYSRLMGKKDSTALEAQDTEFRIVDGEASKVRPDEAFLIDLLGEEGEDIVQQIGAGVKGSDGFKHYYQQENSGIGSSLLSAGKFATSPQGTSIMQGLGMSSGAIGAVGAAMPWVAGAAMVADWGIGSYNEAAKNRALLKDTRSALGELKQDSLNEFERGTEVTMDIVEQSQEKAEEIGIQAGKTISSALDTQTDLIKKQGSLVTGATEQHKDKVTTNVQDSYDLATDDIFTSMEANLDSFGSQQRNTYEEMYGEMGVLEDQITTLEQNDSFLETSGLSSLAGSGLLGAGAFAAKKAWGTKT